MSSLLHYEIYVEQVWDVFRERLVEMSSSPQSQKHGKGAGVDMHHWLQCYAFDVISNITYGRRFGFLDKGEDVDACMLNLERSMIYSSLIGVFPTLHPLLFRLLERIPGTGAAGRAYLMDFVQKRISERRVLRKEQEKSARGRIHDPSTPRDFLDQALDAEQDPEKGMSGYNVFMMGMSNIVAGSDTTAVSLSSVLYHLLRNPRTIKKLRGEFEEAIKEGRMTREKIEFRESQRCEYLQVCIKEALRLCSATGLPLWRVVPPEGVEIEGKFFPGGTELGVNIW